MKSYHPTTAYGILVGVILLGVLGIRFIPYERDTPARQVDKRHLALIELGCGREVVRTWHDYQGRPSDNPHLVWVCDGQLVDDQTAGILADERLKGGSAVWTNVRRKHEEWRRIDTR